MYLNDIYTIGANLAGLPGSRCPAVSSTKLPVGLHLVGPHVGEERLLNVTHRTSGRPTGTSRPEGYE